MVKKPTYKELEKRVTELEKKPGRCRHLTGALEESERRLRDLLDNLGLFFYETDSSRNVTYASHMGETATSVSLKDVIGNPFFPLFAQESQETALDAYERTLKGESTEADLTLANGKTCHLKKLPLRDQNNRITGVVGIGGDITGPEGGSRALEQKVAQLDSFINNIPDMAWLKDADSRFIAVNRAFGDAVGMAPQSLLRKTCAVCFGKEAARKFRKDDQQVMKEDRQVVIEEKVVDAQKKALWLETIKSPIKDRSGKVSGTVGIARDISDRKRLEEALRKAHDSLEEQVQERTAKLTKANERLKMEIEERKRAEAALRESEEKYRSLVERANDGIGIVQDGIMTYANPRLADMGDYPVEEVIGAPFAAFIHPDELQKVAAHYRNRMGGGNVPQSYETRLLHKDGGTIHGEISGGVVTYEGRPGDLIIVRDITGRKQTVEALEASEAKYRHLVENINDIIFSIDEHGVVTYVSPVVESVMGYRPSEAVGRPFADFVHPQDLPWVSNRFQEVLSGQVEPSEYRVLTASGETRWIVSSSRPILEDGRAIGLRGVMRDITQRKEAEEALQETSRRLEIAYKQALQYGADLTQEVEQRRLAEEALREKERELEDQAHHLEEVNAALKVLLELRDKEKEELEKAVLTNVQRTVFPYLEKLEKGLHRRENRTYLGIVTSNLQDLISPFAAKLSHKSLNLTPTELQVADLVKYGKTSKEIAALLHVSIDAVLFHRKNIRKRLGLAKKKINLRSYLQSLSLED
ncbi:MAG: PAS domain S-box protein [Thermodesulfobacteriota bacterium]|nr:PAS domain S-box protein [Thermodesulfobacteriota bacterium]